MSSRGKFWIRTNNREEKRPKKDPWTWTIVKACDDRRRVQTTGSGADDEGQFAILDKSKHSQYCEFWIHAHQYYSEWTGWCWMLSTWDGDQTISENQSFQIGKRTCDELLSVRFVRGSSMLLMNGKNWQTQAGSSIWRIDDIFR